jgi:hemerythrin
MEPPRIWSSVHLVGIEVIDEQHAHLASLMDTLFTMLKAGADQGTARGQLNEIVRYARFHFATEEELMTTDQIDDLVPHRNAHQRLLEDIEKLDLPDDNSGISLILRYLQEWLFRHIDGCDRQLADALLARGCH